MGRIRKGSTSFKPKLKVTIHRNNKRGYRTSTQYLDILSTPDTTSKDRLASTYTTQPDDFALQDNTVVHQSFVQDEITSHSIRQEICHLDWTRSMSGLLMTHYNYSAPATSTCAFCAKNEDEIIWCSDCGPMAYMCLTCADYIHQVAILHRPYKWQGSVFVPRQWTKRLKTPHQSQCESSTRININVIDKMGRQHEVEIFSCHHESSQQVMVASGLWPASPVTTQTAVDQKLLVLYESMLMENQMPMNAFCRAISHFKGKFDNIPDNVDLYRIFSGESGYQFHIFRDHINKFTDICDDIIPDGTQCPICENTPDLPKIYSLDGNFRLVRRRAGVSPYAPYHSGHFFIEKLNSTGSSDDVHNEECHNFKAGKIISTAKSKKFDITGIFGCICVHNFPKYFIDMDSGESLAYAKTILRKLQDDGVGKVKVLYDVACKLEAHLKKNENELLGEVDVAIPVFHCFAHITKCQILYNPKRKADFRLADGENIERFWSDMDNFSRTSRTMTKTHRQDVLAFVFLNYGNRVINEAPNTITKRVRRARQFVEDANKALKEIYHQFSGVSEQTILEWAKKEEAMASQQTCRASKNGGWQEEYAVTLHKWHCLRKKLVEGSVTDDDLSIESDVDRLNKKLCSIENKHKLTLRWEEDNAHYTAALHKARLSREAKLRKQMQIEAVHMHYLIHHKEKSKSSHEAEKFSKGLKSAGQKLEKYLQQYNKLAGTETLTFQEAKKHDGDVYQDLPAISEVPYPIHRKGIDNLMLRLRSEEEIDASDKELQALFSHHHRIAQALKDRLSTIHQAGHRTVITVKLLNLEAYQRYVAATINDLFSREIVVDTPVHDGLSVTLLSNNESGARTMDDEDEIHGDFELDLQSDSDDISCYA